MKKFFDQNQLGYGQTIAVIESCGTWGSMKNALTNSQSPLPKTLREDYKDRFLAPIGKGPGGNPNIKDAYEIKVDPYDHGSLVASVLMDLSPQAKVLPVSTGIVNAVTKYNTEDALMELAARKDVNIVNLSGGVAYFASYYNLHFNGYNSDGTPKRGYPIFFDPKVVKSFKAIIKSGKVIVMAAGNEGEQLNEPRKLRNHQDYHHRDYYHYLFQHIFKGLTEEEKKSVILAGNLNSDTRLASPCSNRPGSKKENQNRFLFAPGKGKISYLDSESNGTCFSAAYISSALANLLSKSKKITPKAAVKTLLDSAELQKDVATYGRGIIRADRALDWLEVSK